MSEEQAPYLSDAAMYAEAEHMDSQLADLSPASIVSLFETKKDQRQAFADAVVMTVTEGYKSPLDIHLQLKCMEDIIDRIKENPQYQNILLEEAEKQGKNFEWHNAKMNIRSAGGKWDFKNTGDSKLFEMEAQMKSLDRAIKERKVFLQNIPEGGMADPETGEMIYKAAAPASESVIAVTLQ